jgi:hypothetical protein
MNQPISKLRMTIIPKSDQLNAEDFMSTNAMIRVLGVDVDPGRDQPVWIYNDYDQKRPYKPSKSMRKILVDAWGDDENAWVGRRLLLFRDPEVTFGGDKVGGIVISHMTHIKGDFKIKLQIKRGKQKEYTVKKLPDEPVASQTGIDPVALAAAADILTKAASHGVEALKLAGGSIDPSLVAPLKDHYKSLMPIAKAADQANMAPEIQGFNAAPVEVASEPVQQEQLPVVEDYEQKEDF